MPSKGRAIAKLRTGFSMVGDVELKRKLDTLSDKVFRKVIRKASNAGMTPVVKSAKAKAPKETGLLRKSIGKKTKTYQRAGVIVTLVGPRTGFREEVTVETPAGPQKVTRDPVKYAHLVEFGTAPHKVGTGESLKKKKRQSKVKVYDHPGAAARPFMRPAFDENVSRIESAFRAQVAAGVIEEAKKRA